MPSKPWAPIVVGLGLAALFHLPSPVSAGDYLLTVANHADAACAEQARKIRTWCEEQRKAGAACVVERSWPIASAAGVVDDLGRYFAGEETEIGILIVSFANGHVDFCGEVERSAVGAGLAAIAARDDLRHASELADILRIHASRAILEGLRKQLAREDLAAPARRRLVDLAVVVETALGKRRSAG